MLNNTIILLLFCVLSPVFAGNTKTSTSQIPLADNATVAIPSNKAAKDEKAPNDAELYQRGRMAFLFGYFDTAYLLWKPLAYKGLSDAEASLGWMYYTGNGRPKDHKLAFKWFKKAARQKHPIAQNNLGVMFDLGLGVTKNRTVAMQWYLESAEWGYSYGQYNIGKSLLENSPSAKNKKDAIYWLDLAAQQGVSQAKTLLENTLHQRTQPLKKMITDYSIQQEDWLLKQNPEFFTVLLFTTHDKRFLLDFIRHNDLLGAVAYFNNGQTADKENYSLIYGNFSSFQNAKIALKSLPSNLVTDKPSIKKYREIQTVLKHVNLNFPSLEKTH